MLVATSTETAHHSDDVVVITEALCTLVGIDEAERADVVTGARLHDIGKASIPAGVLTKPGPLSPKEWELMRQHTIVGSTILESVVELQGVARLVRHSHERWDGQGYPDGLAGDEIPLGSRIIFCADAFHAIRSDRPYRAGRSAVEALAEVKRCAGTQFDPEVAAALEQVSRDLRLAPARVRRGSGRLAALLLILALGAGGTAMARTGVLGEPDRHPASPQSAGLLPDCTPVVCPSLLGISVNDLFGQRPGGDHALPGAVSFLPHLIGNSDTSLGELLMNGQGKRGVAGGEAIALPGQSSDRGAKNPSGGTPSGGSDAGDDPGSSTSPPGLGGEQPGKSDGQGSQGSGHHGYGQDHGHGRGHDRGHDGDDDGDRSQRDDDGGGGSGDDGHDDDGDHGWGGGGGHGDSGGYGGSEGGGSGGHGGGHGH